jgi:hypothetical protein
MMKSTTFRLFSKNLNLYKQITVKYQNVNKNLKVDSPLLSVRNKTLNFRNEHSSNHLTTTMKNSSTPNS